MLVQVHWTELKSQRNSLLDETLCLYAYLHLTRDWILYIGKADFQSVWQRMWGKHKEEIIRDIRREYGIPQVRVMHGHLKVARRTSELLSDVESLLINRIKPYGNQHYMDSRPTSRPGMVVECTGDWPMTRYRFIDSD